MGVSPLRWMTNNPEVIRGQELASGKSDQMGNDQIFEKDVSAGLAIAIFIHSHSRSICRCLQVIDY